MTPPIDETTVEGEQETDSATEIVSTPKWDFSEDANFVVNDLILSEAVQLSKQLLDEYSNENGCSVQLKSEHANASACATPRTNSSPNASLHGCDPGRSTDSCTGSEEDAYCRRSNVEEVAAGSGFLTFLENMFDNAHTTTPALTNPTGTDVVEVQDSDEEADAI